VNLLRIVSIGFLLQLPLSSFLSAQVLDPPLEISFLADAVEVTNLSPGAQVVWFGATQVLADDDVPEIRAYASIGEDTDADGVERLDFPDGVPLHSTWVAVDLANGKSAAAAPAGYPLRSVPWQGAGIQANEGVDDVVTDARQTANLLLVRAGEKNGGAWIVEAGDGGPTDADSAVNGAVSLELSALEPLGSTADPAPSHFESGDVVAMLDPRLLELTLVTIK
jgi:hypothetical protein